MPTLSLNILFSWLKNAGLIPRCSKTFQLASDLKSDAELLQPNTSNARNLAIPCQLIQNWFPSVRACDSFDTSFFLTL